MVFDRLYCDGDGGRLLELPMVLTDLVLGYRQQRRTELVEVVEKRREFLAICDDDVVDSLYDHVSASRVTIL